MNSSGNAFADQQPMVGNDPGRGTLAKVYVINRDRADAVPVTLQAVASTDALRVTVTGTPSCHWMMVSPAPTRRPFASNLSSPPGK